MISPWIQRSVSQLFLTLIRTKSMFLFGRFSLKYFAIFNSLRLSCADCVVQIILTYFKIIKVTIWIKLELNIRVSFLMNLLNCIILISFSIFLLNTDETSKTCCSLTACISAETGEFNWTRCNNTISILVAWVLSLVAHFSGSRSLIERTEVECS